MIKFVCENISFHKTWEEMVKPFIGFKSLEDYEKNVIISICKKDSTLFGKVYIDDILICEKSLHIAPLDDVRAGKVLVYDMASLITGKTLPWGTLTGIRPVSYMNWCKNEYGDEYGLKVFKENCRVREDKVQLCKTIDFYEHEIIEKLKEKHLVYVHIPFCETRCSYCSFSVMTMDKFGKWMDKYVPALISEIEFTYNALPPENAIAAYIGGGTPSTLSLSDTDRLLNTLNEKFPNLIEITFEAGRPESITDELMKVLVKNKVTRISINPQSMVQETLDNIGRKHRVEDIYKAFQIAKKFPVEINMDMITGLVGEGADEVAYTLSEILKLAPDNVTIHSLAVKSGSRFRNDNVLFNYDELIDRNKLYSSLYEKGYHPYYLYRQKRQLGEAENVGFAKPNKENIFNILSMNDLNHVLAFGMGAVTKYVDSNLDCHRVFGYRDIICYLDRLDELCNKKIEEALNLM